MKYATHEVVIESPFIACKRTDELLPVFRKLRKHGVKVRINTRNPRHHDKELCIQAWVAMKRLRAVGVKVKFYDDYRHRKLAVIDSRVLWEGSLNILSQSCSKEIMRRTVSETLALQMLCFTGMNKWSW
ncbi:MAG: phospholipase D-like domain-containing protein [Patescibacteria group bacterium]